ncbi:MAG: chemotaxis protein CheA [Negativicutes bacterium]|nr:chemotaxis protein CheA [Negativicutes bacterium]
MEINQYMGMFLEESREHLQTLNRCLLELETQPDNLSVLDEIFRSAHTIKGMSATMGFTTVAELTHEMENILDMLRKAQIKADHIIIDVLFKCVDTLEQLVECITNNQECSEDIRPLVSTLQALASGQAGFEAAATLAAVAEDSPVQSMLALDEVDTKIIYTAQNQGMQAYEVIVSLKEGCLLKSARAYMVMRTLEELGEVIKSVPPVEDLERENFDLKFQVVLISDREPDKIRDAVMSISEVEKTDILPYAKITLDKKPRLGIAESKPKLTAEPPKENIEHSAVQSALADKKIKSGQSVRVDIERLDTLLNLVGELVINKTRLEQIGLTHRLNDLAETIELMDRITTDLQAVVMKVRMVPVGQVFNRFPRMVRDLSRDLKKEVNLIIQGEETELDRTVIDELGDPLVHLLRNAIDHGIETPAERQAKGKNPVGEIKLIARHEGNNVIILVEDDGRGINPDVIKRKAVDKQLITQAEADKMDSSEVVNLLFLPGFSTAETITDVSGRGVGMDAVKTKIEALGGMVDIETKINEGSKFKIRLPLTLAIIQALLVKVHAEIYAIPLSSIDSTINITPADIKTIQNQEVILLRGQIIPIIRLAEKLGVPQIPNDTHEELFVVIVHMGSQRAGIIVDTLIGQQEIVIKSLGKLLAGIKVIAGATILGNGQVALILDVGSIIQ